LTGLPSPAEIACLANLKEWEAGVEFDFEKWGGVEWPDIFRNDNKAAISFHIIGKETKPITKPRRLPKWWPEATPAVRRAYLQT